MTIYIGSYHACWLRYNYVALKSRTHSAQIVVVYLLVLYSKGWQVPQKVVLGDA